MAAVFGDDRTTPVTFEQLSELSYLECCIKESMRLMPPVPIIERVTAVPMKLDDNYEIPADVDVGVHIYQLHRDADNFPDPETFDPDRFTVENSKGRHPYAYVPFSAGLRNCIGEWFLAHSDR